MHWQASESQRSQPAPPGGLAAHAGDGCLATASLSHWHVRRRSGFGCAASAVAPAALQGHMQYAPLQVPAAEAGPQSLRRLPLPVFEPPSLLSLRVPPPPVRPALGECSRCSALNQMPLLTGRLRLGTVVQCLRATAARNGCPLAPLYCIGTAGPAGPPAPASGRVASPATATKPTPEAANLKRTAAHANLKSADIRSFFKK